MPTVDLSDIPYAAPSQTNKIDLSDIPYEAPSTNFHKFPQISTKVDLSDIPYAAPSSKGFQYNFSPTKFGTTELPQPSVDPNLLKDKFMQIGEGAYDATMGLGKSFLRPVQAAASLLPSAMSPTGQPVPMPPEYTQAYQEGTGGQPGIMPKIAGAANVAGNVGKDVLTAAFTVAAPEAMAIGAPLLGGGMEAVNAPEMLQAGGQAVQRAVGGAPGTLQAQAGRLGAGVVENAPLIAGMAAGYGMQNKLLPKVEGVTAEPEAMNALVDKEASAKIAQDAITKSIQRHLGTQENLGKPPEVAPTEPSTVTTEPGKANLLEAIKATLGKIPAGKLGTLEDIFSSQSQKLAKETSPDIAQTSLDLKRNIGMSKNLAGDMAKWLNNSFSPAEQQQIFSMAEGLPKQRLNENQRPASEQGGQGRLSLNDLDAVKDRMAQYYNIAGPQASGLLPARPELADAVALVNSVNRTMEDIQGQNPNAVFNRQSSGQERRDLNTTMTGLRKDLGMGTVPETGQKIGINEVMDRIQEKESRANALKQSVQDVLSKNPLSKQPIATNPPEPQASQFKLQAANKMSEEAANDRVKANQYLDTVARMQQEAVQGGKGYMRHIFPQLREQAAKDYAANIKANPDFVAKTKEDTNFLMQRDENLTSPTLEGKMQKVQESGLGQAFKPKPAEKNGPLLKTPSYPEYESIYNNGALGSIRQAFDHIAKSEFVLTGVPEGSPGEAAAFKKGYSRADDPRLGSLDGTLVPPAIAKELNIIKDFGAPSAKDLFLQTWAKWHAVGDWQQTLRHGFSNMMVQNAYLGIPLEETTGLLDAGREAFKDPKFALYARKITSQMLRDQDPLAFMKTQPELQGLYKAQDALKQQKRDLAASVVSKVADGFDSIFDFISKTTQKVPGLGQTGKILSPNQMSIAHSWMDAYQRVGSVKWLMDNKGMDFNKAMNEVLKAHTDYSDPILAAKMMGEFGIKSLPGLGAKFQQYRFTQLGNAMKYGFNANPLTSMQVWKWPALISHWNDFMRNSITKETDEERKLRLTTNPPTERSFDSSFQLVTGRDKDGRIQQSNLLNWMPMSAVWETASLIHNLATHGEKSVNAFANIVGLNPLAQTTMDVSRNESTFYNKPIAPPGSGSNLKNALTIGAPALGWYALSQTFPDTYGHLPVGMLNTYRQKEYNPLYSTGAYRTTYMTWQQQLLYYLTGFRVRNVNIPQQQMNLGSEGAEKKRQMLENYKQPYDAKTKEQLRQGLQDDMIRLYKRAGGNP